MLRIITIVLISVMLFSCASKKKDDENIRPVEEIYNDSMDKLEHKKYKKAIEGFEELERTYPYSKWAIKSQLMSAYSSFKNEEYTDAIVTLDKFISLHPGNKDVAYAYYLKAISYYEQISDITRDQSYSVLARNALKDVVARFPTSAYARDAQGKLDLVTDYLGGKELEVGRFYLKQKRFISAINRFKEVIEKYQTTSHVPEALHRLVEANLALGVKEEAYKYAAVLGYNYPGSKWYRYSYNLMDGKKPGITPEYSVFGSTVEFLKKPFNRWNRKENLVDSIDKNVNELGQGGKSIKSQPATNREVKVNDIDAKPTLPDKKKNKLLQWFKDLKVPFVNRK